MSLSLPFKERKDLIHLSLTLCFHCITWD